MKKPRRVISGNLDDQAHFQLQGGSHHLTAYSWLVWNFVKGRGTVVKSLSMIFLEICLSSFTTQTKTSI